MNADLGVGHLGNLLGAVVAAARRAAEERARDADRRGIDRAIAERAPNGRGFVQNLRQPGIRVIAECKRRSPSRGVLRPVYDPVTIAESYAAAGAAAISVLTEPTFFDGALDHLRAVRKVVDVPLLCKDFIVTAFQLREAAAAGADAALLIVGALDDAALRVLVRTGADLGLAMLVEAHDATETVRAIDAGAEVVGINSRDLRTLDVRTDLFEELSSELPRSVVAVAESGLKDGVHLRRLRALRYDAFLVGERFMTEDDPGAALAAMIDAAGESR